MSPWLEQISRYPVKSCRGSQVDQAVVEACGLAGDRRWMVVDDDGRFITARECPTMLLVSPRADPGGGLTVTAAGHDPLTITLADTGNLRPVQVWSSRLDAAPAGPAADGWFSAVLGRPAHLVYLDDPTRRRPDPAYARATDRVSFADGYPLLLSTNSSLTALNNLIAQGAHADEGPLPMARFRPNVVIAGTQAWEEDGWRRVRIGPVRFRVVKGCARCAITMTDPDTALRGKEPVATLARHRRWDGQTWFGMNLVPDGLEPGREDVEVTVGDQVEVLEAVPAPDGPLR